MHHDTSHIYKKVNRLDFTNVKEAYLSGGIVNIFDLLELICRNPRTLNDNSITLRVAEAMKPGNFLEDPIGDLQDTIFELLRMKITAKLAKNGFDYKYFYETIDFLGNGSLKFIKFLSIMKDRFALYLSEREIEALFLFFTNKKNELLMSTNEDDLISI